MKKTYYPLSILFAILVLLSACKKKLTDDPPLISVYLSSSTAFGNADSIKARFSFISFTGSSEDTALVYNLDTVDNLVRLDILRNTITPVVKEVNARRGNLGKIRLYLDTVGTHFLWEDSVRYTMQLDPDTTFYDIVINDVLENGKRYSYNINIDLEESITGSGSTFLFDPVLSIKRD